MTNWIMIVLTVIVVFFTYLVWKVYERIAWLTGAMETHSDLMLRIEAKRGINGHPIKLVWWDPTLEPPPVTREHGKEIDLNTIYMYRPLSQRRNRPAWWARAKDLLRFP